MINPPVLPGRACCNHKLIAYAHTPALALPAHTQINHTCRLLLLLLLLLLLWRTAGAMPARTTGWTAGAMPARTT